MYRTMIGDPGRRWKMCCRVETKEERKERTGRRKAGISVLVDGELSNVGV